MKFPRKNHNNIFRQMLAIALLLFFCAISSAQTTDGSTELTLEREGYRRIDKIVAIVNGEVITQSDVNRVLATIEAEYKAVYSNPEELNQKLKQIKENIVAQMVEEKLILSEAKRYDIKVEEEKIKGHIEQIRENFPTDEEFELTLDMQGLTLKDLQDRFRDQEIMKKAVDYFVRSEIKVDPMEIQLFFKSHQEEFVYPERALVKAIFIRVDESCNEGKARERAEMVLARLKKGESFEELAKLYSQGVSASDGGDLGFVEKGQLIKEVDQIIFSLQSAEFSDAIKTPQGFRIFKVETKEPSRRLSFSEAQDLVRDTLYKQKFSEIFKKWITKLKQDAYISIKEYD